VCQPGLSRREAVGVGGRIINDFLKFLLDHSAQNSWVRATPQLLRLGSEPSKDAHQAFESASIDDLIPIDDRDELHGEE
jgi:hypothetical protein